MTRLLGNRGGRPAHAVSQFASLPPASILPRRSLDLARLEDRILYSAAPVPTAPTPDAVPTPSSANGTHVVFTAPMAATTTTSGEALSDVHFQPTIHDLAHVSHPSTGDLGTHLVTDALHAATAHNIAGQPLATSAADQNATTTNTLHASGDATLAVVPSAAQSQSTPVPLPVVPPRWELVVVDTGVANYEQLIADIRGHAAEHAHFEIVVLDAHRDGVAQVTELLRGHEHVDALHLVGHGADGAIKLGNVWLTGDNIGRYAHEIALWQNALSADADILLYGCGVASGDAGHSLVAALSQLTEADVAASIDDTGTWETSTNDPRHQSNDVGRQRDWILEHATGPIETRSLFAGAEPAHWHGLMSAPTAVADGYAVNEDVTLSVTSGGVLGNDSDPESDPLTAVLVTGPAHGSLNLHPDGTFTYTPDADFHGVDTFTYLANDGTADSNVVTVTITVHSVNDAPAITDPGSQNGTEDTAVELSFAHGNGVAISDVDAGNAAGLGTTPSYIGTVAHPSTVTLDVWANYNTLGVRLYYTEHASLAGTTVAGTLQVLVNNQWVDAHDFVHDVDQNMLVSKVFGLTEGQSYTVRASFVRTDANSAILEQHILYGTTTTLATPTGGTGGQIWIAPNGNDFYPGTYALPMRTIAAAAAELPVGGYLMLKDGNYFFDAAAQEHVIRNLSGTAAQPFTITAEHPGQARIFGYEEVNGPWTAYGNGIFWTDAASLIISYWQGDLGPNRFIDTATGEVLYTYRSLTTDNVSTNVFAIDLHPEPGWYLDFATQRLYVKLESGLAPTVGQIRAGTQDAGLLFDNSSYWIVDGLHFEQFGETFRPLGDSNYYRSNAQAIQVYSSDHITIRNSIFRHTGIGLFDTAPAPNHILIENNSFFTNGVWDRLYQEPFETSYWQRQKDTPLEIFAIYAGGMGRGLVIRGNSFDGYSTSVDLTNNHQQFANDVDIHDNASYRNLDDVYELDSTTSATDGGGVNVAIFHNTSSGCLTFVSASSFYRGPMWVIGNTVEDCLFQPIKPGQQMAGDPVTNTVGWKLIYNNTFYTDVVATDPDSAAVWFPNQGFGNLVAKNNIFVGNSRYVFTDNADAGAHRAPVLFESNLFYTLRGGPNVWVWEKTHYTSEDALDAAATMLEMTDNFYQIHPFPSGFGGPLNPLLAGQSAQVKGITNIAAGGGAVDLGAFGGFAYPSGGSGVPLVSPVQVTLVATHGSVTLASLAGLTFLVGDGAADSVMTIVGTVADINAALEGMRFAPTVNFHGVAQLQISVNDLGNAGAGGELVDNRTISFSFAAVNDAPVANADRYATYNDSPLTAALPGVLGNDFDVESDPLVVMLLSGPSHGVLQFQPDGSFIYTPARGYIGPVSFTYQVSDGTTTSAPATVTILVRSAAGGTGETVAPLEHPLAANPVSASIDADVGTLVTSETWGEGIAVENPRVEPRTTSTFFALSVEALEMTPSNNLAEAGSVAAADAVAAPSTTAGEWLPPEPDGAVQSPTVNAPVAATASPIEDQTADADAADDFPRDVFAPVAAERHREQAWRQLATSAAAVATGCLAAGYAAWLLFQRLTAPRAGGSNDMVTPLGDSPWDAVPVADPVENQLLNATSDLQAAVEAVAQSADSRQPLANTR